MKNKKPFTLSRRAINNIAGMTFIVPMIVGRFAQGVTMVKTRIDLSNSEKKLLIFNNVLKFCETLKIKLPDSAWFIDELILLITDERDRVTEPDTVSP